MHLGRLLVDRGLLTSAQLDEAVVQQEKMGMPLGHTLLDLGVVTVDEILKALSDHFQVPATRVNAYTMDPEAIKSVPEKIARKHSAFPLFRVGNALTVAIADPSRLDAIDELRFVTGYEIQPVVAMEEEIGAALDRFYHGDLPSVDLVIEGLVILEEPPSARYQRDAEADQTATRLVDQILARAAADRASDIHVDPQEAGVRLRLRIDGMLKDIATLPKRLAPSITARLKILAGMNISEHRLPQDGRFSAVVGSRRLDVRAATYPTVFGEKTTVRLLDRTALNVGLEDIGMSVDLLATYRELIQRSEGLVLVTGPTGSGKTSTLYGSLRELSERGLNIITLEDPVEYELPGINQGQVRGVVGFTFARGLRAILRQDPDIILVGEIRDRETLDVSIEAALTGHLVLATLHTNSAAATIIRLVDMGLEPYLLASAVIGIVAQRLVRRICETCRVATPTLPEVARLFPPPPPAELWRGKGCRACGVTGYRGRSGLFELLRMTEEIRRLVIQCAPEDELGAANRRHGHGTLREAGLRSVVEGTTTLEEVLRVTKASE